MKKLVCASEVEAAVKTGQKAVHIDCNTIITPAAKDAARELGVLFTAAQAGQEAGGAQQESRTEGELDREVICQIVKAVLASQLLSGRSAFSPPYLSETELKSGVKIIRGRTVQFENFDTGNPAANVSYREVIGKSESQMSAGFLTIEQSSFDWELSYEEIDVILEGNLSVTINGVTQHAAQGDVLFIPKGTKITWSAASYVKLFYVTYPANWAELMSGH